MKKFIKITLIVIIALVCNTKHKLYCQNTGPASPEYSSFEPVDAADMVNFLTGDFTYTLPIIGIPGPEGGYPLAISNHAGITLDQEASWVGLGWTLNAGAINRQVNTVPDDSKEFVTTNIGYQNVQSDVYHEISIFYGIGKGVAGVGVSVGWYQYNTFGGEVSLGPMASVGPFSASMSEDNASFGVNPTWFLTKGKGSIGSNIGISTDGNTSTFSASMGPIGISTDGYSATFSAGISGPLGSSLGISYNTAGGGVRFYGQASGYISASSFHAPNFSTQSFSIYIPLQAILYYLPNIGYSRTELKTWLFDTRPITNYGTLYMSDAYKTSETETWHQENNTSSDTYIIPYSESNYTDANEIEKSNCLTYPAFDNYAVSAQGLSGSMAPAIFDWGTLPRQAFMENYNDDGKPTEVFQFLHQKPINSNRIEYYFHNELVSYLNADQVLFSWDQDNYPFPENEFASKSKPVFNPVNSDGKKFFENGRKGGLNHVEYFSNSQIQAAYQNNNNAYTSGDDIIRKGFIEFERLKGNRDDEYLFDPQGIGAFSITSADGKTYHYSLPVYQFEEFTSYEEITAVSRSSKKFVEMRQTELYAYTWLLTAITGPDFVDRGTIGVIDNADYGYWVKFDYGKWSDAYIWRTPYTGYGNIEKGWGTYTWGRKQVYYLDAIQTRTHTALFLKEEREDALGAKNTDVFTTCTYTIKPRLDEDDCNEWEIFCKFGESDFNAWMNPKVVKDGQIIKQITQEHKINLPTQHKSLRLKKIILIENSKLAKISKNTSSTSPTAHSIEVYEERWWGVRKDSDSFTKDNTKYNHYKPTAFYSSLINNVYDITDFTKSSLVNSEILKEVEFGYDYSLCNNTPNSSAGKLTLKDITMKGKGGYSYMPPYAFEYTSNPDYTTNKTDMNNWGYLKSDPAAWSLSAIHTPIGSKVLVNYEEDDYKFESALGTLRYNVKVETDIFANHTINYVDLEFTLPQEIDISKIGSMSFAVWSELNGNTYDVWHDDPFCDYYGECEPDSIYVMYNHIPIADKYFKNKSASFVSKNVSNRKIKIRVNHTTPTFDFEGATHWDYVINKAEKNTIIIKGLDQDLKGGGIRVASLELKDNNSTISKTEYTYEESGLSTGVISYAPFENDPIYIPYITEIPGPIVMYNAVKVANIGSNNQENFSTIYRFNSLPSATFVDNEFSLGSAFHVEECQRTGTNKGNGTYDLGSKQINDNRKHLVLARSSVIHDYLSSVGSINSIETYNSFGDLITKSTFQYRGKNEIPIGIIKETYSDAKYFVDFDNGLGNYDVHYYFTTSSRIKYPIVLASVKNESSMGSSQTIYGNAGLINYGFNIENGSCQSELSIVESDLFENNVLFANDLTAYRGSSSTPGMGSKLYNFENKNMLTQTAATLTKKNGKVIDASIQTWKGDWSNNYGKYGYLSWNATTGRYDYNGTDNGETIWRKHKTYIWNGDLDAEGNYSSDFANFNSTDNIKLNWGSIVSEPTTSKWLKTSEVIRYDHYSSPIEAMDINGDYAATKKDPDQLHTVATAANARHTQFAHCGFEYGPYIDYHGEAGTYINYSVNVLDSTQHEVHTGEYCMVVGSTKTGVEYRVSTTELYYWQFPATYRVSVWKYNEWNSLPSPEDLSISGPGTVLASNSFRAGNWVLYTKDFSISSNPGTDISFKVTNNGINSRSIYIDDFRVSPYEAAVTAYTYDYAGNVTSILNNDNFGVKYEYDAAGRLISTYVEKPTGFEKVSSNKYNYANE